MKRRGRPPYPDLLTPREQEVLALLRKGLSNDQIAERLGVSLAGAKYHVSEILSKLGVSSREEAARWAPESRPWWLGALTPIASLRHRLGWAPQLAIGTAVVALAAGVGLLVWGLTRTNGDEKPLASALCAPGEIGNYFIDVQTVNGDSFSGPASSTNHRDLNQDVTVRTDANTTWNGFVQSTDDIRDATVIQATGPWQADCSLLAVNVFSPLSPTAVSTPLTTPTPLAAGTVTTACPGGPTAPATSSPLFAYTAPDSTVWVMDADGKNATQLICDGSSGASWSSSGRYMSYVANDGSLRILDVQTGEDFVADDGTASLITGRQGMQWSQVTDLLVYQKSADINQNGHPQPTEIWSVKPGSAPSKIVDTQSASFWLSPDGRLIAYVQRDENTPTPPTNQEPLRESGQIFLVNSNGSDPRKLTDATFMLYSSSSPWSPDGRLLAFWRNVTGGSALFGDAYILDIGTGHEISLGRLTSDQHAGWSPSPDRYVFHNLAIDPQAQSATPLFDPASSLIDWSPDGTKVAYMQSASSPPTPGGPAAAHSLVVLDIETGQRSTYETSTSDVWVHQPGYPGVWSSDGRYFAFEGGEATTDFSSGQVIYVADTHAGTTRRVLDGFVLGDASFSYSPDARYLLVQQRSGGSPVLSVAAADGSDLAKVADGGVANGAAGWTAWRPAQQ